MFLVACKFYSFTKFFLNFKQGNIRVYCRTRPMLPNEDKENTGMDHIGFDTDEKSLRIFQVIFLKQIINFLKEGFIKLTELKKMCFK